MWRKGAGRADSAIFGVKLVDNIRADGPTRKQVLPHLGLWQPFQRRRIVRVDHDGANCFGHCDAEASGQRQDGDAMALG